MRPERTPTRKRLDKHTCNNKGPKDNSRRTNERPDGTLSNNNGRLHLLQQRQEQEAKRKSEQVKMGHHALHNNDHGYSFNETTTATVDVESETLSHLNGPSRLHHLLGLGRRWYSHLTRKIRVLLVENPDDGGSIPHTQIIQRTLMRTLYRQRDP